MYKYEDAVRYLNDNGMEKTLLLGMVYGIYQDYQIEEDELDYLYEIIDPYERWNDVSEYWWELEEHADELFNCIDKLPSVSKDGEWVYTGGEIMNRSAEDIECLADLFSGVVHSGVHTSTYEEEPYFGMSELHFD